MQRKGRFVMRGWRGWTKKLFILADVIYLISCTFSQCVFAQEAQVATLLNYEPVVLNNPSQDGWKPLSKDEQFEKIEELAFKTAEAGAELLDSLSMSYLAGGVTNLIHLGNRIKSYNDWLRQRYNCEFKVRSDTGFLIYSKSF